MYMNHAHRNMNIKGWPISKTSVEIDNQLFFSFSEEASLQVGAEIIRPTEPATLTTPAKASEFRHSPPTTLAIGDNKADELLVLLSSPWPFLYPKFVTTRLPSHTTSLVLIKQTPPMYKQVLWLASKHQQTTQLGSPTLPVKALKTQKPHPHIYIKSLVLTFPPPHVMSNKINLSNSHIHKL